MQVTKQLDSVWQRARDESRDGEILRRRIAAIGALALGFTGFLVAIGLAVVVLGVLAAIVVAAGIVAFLAAWPRLRAFARDGAAYLRSRGQDTRGRLAPLCRSAQRNARAALAGGRARGAAFARTAVASSSRARGRLAPLRRDAQRHARAAFARGRSRSAALARTAAASYSRATPAVVQRVDAAKTHLVLPGTRRDPTREAINLNALGTQQRREGRYDAAVESHRQALELLRSIDDRRGVALTKSNLALALSHAGDDGWAIGLLEEAAATLRDLGDEECEARIMANLGAAHRRHGRPKEGADVLELALSKLSPASSAYEAIEAELKRAS